MNITHVVESLERGGLEKVTIDLLLEQVSLGHNCQIICIFHKGPLAEILENEGVSVYSCQKRSGLDKEAIKKIREKLKDQQCNVLHTHNAMAHYYSVMAARGLELKSILNTRHGMGIGKFSSLVKQEILYRMTMSKTSHAVAVCEAARRQFVQRFIIPRKKSKVVCNGIRVGEVTYQSQDRQRLRFELGISEDMLAMVSVGRFSEVKDPFTLLEAFLIVKKKVPESVLVFLGEGPLGSDIEMFCQDHKVTDSVKLLGYRNDIKEILWAFDLFVMSSVSEGYSIALLEACAAGLPIVATNVGGNEEIVRHQENGLVVSPKKPLLFADAVIKIFSDQEKRERMGANGREWAEKFAKVERMTSEYLKLYSLS